MWLWQGISLRQKSSIMKTSSTSTLCMSAVQTRRAAALINCGLNIKSKTWVTNLCKVCKPCAKDLYRINFIILTCNNYYAVDVLLPQTARFLSGQRLVRTAAAARPQRTGQAPERMKRKNYKWILWHCKSQTSTMKQGQGWHEEK